MSEYTIILSTTEPNNLVGLLKFRQGDKDSQVLNVTVTENGKLFKIDGLAVFFNSVLPNGTVVRDKVQTIDYANSKLTYKVIDSFLQEVAAISAWFSFESGDKTVDSTKNFRYIVEAGWQSCITQGNYIYELSEIQREIEEIISNKDFTSLISKIDDLENDITAQLAHIAKLINPTMTQNEIQSVLNSRGKIKFIKGIYTLSLENRIGLDIQNDTEISLDKGVQFVLPGQKLDNYQIINIKDKSNISIYGELEIIGDKSSHIGTTGEWGHGVALLGSKDIYIESLKVSKCFGDGLYIGSYNGIPSQNIKIDTIIADDNKRLGVGVVSCKNLNIDTLIATNTSGTKPEAGIDFEPNVATDVLQNININRIISNNNPGGAVWCVPLNTDETISIDIKTVFSTNDGSMSDEASIKIVSNRLTKNNGIIRLRDVRLYDCNKSGVYIRGWSVNDCDLVIDELLVENGGLSSALVYIAVDSTSEYYGNFTVGKIVAKNIKLESKMFQVIRINGLVNKLIKNVFFDQIEKVNLNTESTITNVDPNSEIKKKEKIPIMDKFGIISSDGLVLNRSFSFTCEKGTVGRYTVTHNLNNETSFISVTPYGTTAIVSTVIENPNFFIVQLSDINGTPIDARFSFGIMVKETIMVSNIKNMI